VTSERESGAERRRAFEAEALPHLPRIYAAARRLRWAAGGAADAEDLVQETYLRAYRTFDNFERGTNARAWLLTILYSIDANRRRRSRREPEAWPDDDLEARAARACAGIDWQAASLAAATAGAWGAGETVTAALKRLPEPFRTAVLAVDLEGLTYEEAAAALDCPIGTVRSRLARARRRLAAELAGFARRRGLAGGDDGER
jgi:RNA polymerase sigma-70 factor (ECF subfamily)